MDENHDEYRDPVPSAHPAWQDWDGEIWYYNKRANYYYNRNGTLLHRAIWAKVHGTIPDGHEIHHINRDRTDNRLVNLQLLTIAAHRSLSCRERDDPLWCENRGERTSRGLYNYWANRQPRDVTCAICGNIFQSTGMRAKNCSGQCRKEGARRYAVRARVLREQGQPSR